MYESYGTYVNAEYVDNHDYDSDTDDGTDDDTDDDTGDDTDDDTDDDNDHKKDSYTAADDAAPDAGAAPTQTRPRQTPKYYIFTLFWHEWASDRRCEALDSSHMRDFSSSIDLDGSRGRFIGLNGGL